LAQFAKNRKPTVVFLYAFFEEKCVLGRFLGRPEKVELQHARNQRFAGASKKHHLFDRVVFAMR
jgi:hypothetical protein